MIAERRRLLAKGATLGLLAAAGGWLTGVRLPWMISPLTAPLAAVLAAALMLGSARRRKTVWVLAGGWALLVTVIGLTPLTAWMINALVEDDGAQPADVIVVLSANNRSRSLSTPSLDRMLTGVRLLRQGVAPRLVFTADPDNPRNRFDHLAPALLADLHADLNGIVPFEPLRVRRMTTYTEALSIQAMAQRYGWRRILIVTSPGHTRRAAETYRALGLDARATPAVTSGYDRFDLDSPSQRYEATKEVSYELAALLLYRLRGRR